MQTMYFVNELSFFSFCSALLLLIQSAFCGTGYLDLEELKTSFYSVKILPTPISLPEAENFGAEEAAVHVSSKYGQKYVCHYKKTPPEKPEQSEEKIAEINITDILEPMRGYCLVKTKDWWTYQFCYGGEITQYHLHNDEKSGDIITLGKYESDKKWLPEDLEKLKKSTVNRYHTQKYVNGSTCDLTKKPRKTEVRFSCVEGEVDHIGAVAELETCSYIIFIYTSKICHHPYLRPPTQATASAIECQPIVSQAMYDEYMSQLEAEKQRELKKEAEEREREKAKQQVEEFPESQTNKKVNDILNSLLDPQAVDSTKAKDPSEPFDLSTKVDEHKAKLLSMLNEAIKDKADENIITKYRDTIRKYVSSQFDDIINEAKEELAADGGDGALADSVAEIEQLKTIMASVLDIQLNRLEAKKELEGDEDEDIDSTEENPEAGTEEEEDSERTPETLSGLARSQAEDGKLGKLNPKSKTAKPGTDIKIELIQPQQLEVEMIDLDDIDETSEYYNTAKQAKKQQSEKDNKQLKAVIAVLRPMQEKGTRHEEKKHQQLEENYEKIWNNAHDEL